MFCFPLKYISVNWILVWLQFLAYFTDTTRTAKEGAKFLIYWRNGVYLLLRNILLLLSSSKTIGKYFGKLKILSYLWKLKQNSRLKQMAHIAPTSQLFISVVLFFLFNIKLHKFRRKTKKCERKEESTS